MMPYLISCLKAGLAWILILSTISIGFMPSSGMAALLPSTASLESYGTALGRTASLEKIQSVLQSKLIAQRLEDLGLTPAEIQLRLGQLTDQQIHQVATKLDSLQPGGGGLGIIVVLLVIAILVVILLQVSGHKVIITK